MQVLDERAAVARRKLNMSWAKIRQALDDIRAICESPVPFSLETHASAVEIAERYGYPIYDALIVAAAMEARCHVLYSEAMQDGQIIGALTIRNPFLPRTL